MGLEGRSSWEGGDSWDMKAATMGSQDWNLLLQFDRPLNGLQVYNGVMDTEDMKQFKIAPEKYLMHHKEPVDVNFLVKYGAGHPPAKLMYINVNGKTHFCKEGLGEATGNSRSVTHHWPWRRTIQRQQNCVSNRRSSNKLSFYYWGFYKRKGCKQNRV